jgi:hypothetical protein
MRGAAKGLHPSSASPTFYNARVLFALRLFSAQILFCACVWMALRLCHEPIPSLIPRFTDHVQVHLPIYNGQLAPLVLYIHPSTSFTSLKQFTANNISLRSSIYYHTSARFSLPFVSYDSIKDYKPSLLILYRNLLFSNRADYLSVAANSVAQCGTSLKQHISRFWALVIGQRYFPFAVTVFMSATLENIPVVF